eukprot:gene4074-5100_t
MTYLKTVGNSDWVILSQSVLGGLIFGYNTGIIVGALNPIADLLDLGTILKGVVTISLLIGCLVGSLTGGAVANKIGRKPIILIISILTVGGAIGSAVVSHLAPICIIRLILGLGVGAASSVCPMIVSETVPNEKKGIYGSFFQISITVGILIANILALALKHVGEHNWRWMFAIGAFPGVLLFLIWIILGETPFFLQKKQEILNSNEKSRKPSSISCLFRASNRKPMLTGFMLAVLIQLTGINAFMYFSTTIFKDAGFTEGDSPDIAAIIMQVWNVLTTLVAIFLVERLGRRMLIMIGATIMTISDLIIALFFVVLSGSSKGWAAIFWFVVGETMPDDIKHIGSPIINGCQWLFNLLVSFFFLVGVDYLGQSVMFWIFGGIGVVCTIYLYFFLPDLKTNKDLDQIDLPKDDPEQFTPNGETIVDNNIRP